MKSRFLLATVAFVALGSFLMANAGEGSEPDGDLLPGIVGTYEISPEVRETANRILSISGRLEYLTSLVTNRTSDSIPEDNFKKASAIRLLGATRDTNSIDVLLSVLEFDDVKFHTYPAVESVVAIGEAAVQPLVDLVRAMPPNRKRVSLAVQALRKIKGNRYDEFVKGLRGQLSEEAWENLLRYAIIY